MNANMQAMKAGADIKQGERIEAARLGQLVSNLIILNLFVTEAEEPKLAGLVAGLEVYNFLQAAKAARNGGAYFEQGRGKTEDNRKRIINILLNYGAVQLIGHAGVGLLKLKSNTLPNLTGSNILGMVSPVFPGSIVSIGGLSGRRSTDKSLARRAMGPTATLIPPYVYAWHHHEVMGIMMAVLAPYFHVADHVGGVLFWSIANDKDYSK